MPLTTTFDPFRRFRLRSIPVPLLSSSSEQDSDESSPECDQPCIIHVSASKNGCKPGEPLLGIPENPRMLHGAPEKFTEGTHITLSLHDAPHASRPERPSKKSGHSALASDPTDASQPPAKPSLIRRVTSKLNISIPSRSNSHHLRSRPSARTLPAPTMSHTPGPRPTRATIPVSSTLPNGFISKEHREAALRERGLLPPRKDLSEQEQEADTRLDCLPSPASVTFDGKSEAEQFKATWLATSRTSACSDSESGPARVQGTKSCPRVLLSPSSVPPPDADVSRRSGEGATDPACIGRPSICSSVPPLSTSSYLEVLHEDPSEQGPITPPPPLSLDVPPIIVSTVLEYPSSAVFAESPTSYTFSSRCAGSLSGSLLEVQSQPDHPHVPEKNVRSHVSRRHTSDSGSRGRKVVGPSLGSRSLSNLGRSVAGSFRLSSLHTFSSADLHSSTHSVVQAPRVAIHPTIHSLGSIIRETGHIEDVESRRLSELAFLD